MFHIWDTESPRAESGYKLDWTGFRSSAEAKDSFPLASVSRQALKPTQCPIQWILGSSPGGKTRPERDADHSPSTSAEVKNE
jgi:hypothetical protein